MRGSIEAREGSLLFETPGGRVTARGSEAMRWASFSIRLPRLDEAELRDVGTAPGKQFFLAQDTFKTALVPRWTLGLDCVVDCPATASKLCHARLSGIGG